MNLTELEIERLTATKSQAEWDAVCNEIKRARGGEYPPDWYARVQASGLEIRNHAAWGSK